MVQKNSKKTTLEDLYAFLHESVEESKRDSKKIEKNIEKFQKKTDLQIEKTARQIEETDRQMKETARQIEETDRQMKETDRQMKETDRKLRELGRQLGDMGNSNGDIAEEYFQNAFLKNPKLNGEKYDIVNFNVSPISKDREKQDEYDIVLLNGKSVAIIEIKYHLDKNEIKEYELSKILNKIETFKAFYPEYKNHKFYLGIASLAFSKSVEDKIRQAGIAVIKQVGDKMVINSKNLKAF
ncbi:MAG: hypothetical protein FWG49_00505 [Leptospirales bacterium]|nr:hypothetical protein [Leptospirales bacterium]